eukprot:COSAG01_NODE_5333_length_4327_cov_10.804872_2_plen_228_part_00
MTAPAMDPLPQDALAAVSAASAASGHAVSRWAEFRRSALAQTAAVRSELMSPSAGDGDSDRSGRRHRRHAEKQLSQELEAANRWCAQLEEELAQTEAESLRKLEACQAEAAEARASALASSRECAELALELDELETRLSERQEHQREQQQQQQQQQSPAVAAATPRRVQGWLRRVLDAASETPAQSTPPSHLNASRTPGSAASASPGEPGHYHARTHARTHAREGWK